jgi:ribosomal protein S18 acetylase RimI-like enzyme
MLVFVPMTENDYQSYAEQGVKSYAQENVRAGIWQASEAEAKAEQVYLQLLPEGLATKDHCFYKLMDPEAGMTVGHIWYCIRTQGPERTVFLYDIEIYAAYRRKGYGTQVMQALEARAREINATRIALHVFGHNRAARTLYENLGYEVMSLQMVKCVTPSWDEQDGLPGHVHTGNGGHARRVSER